MRPSLENIDVILLDIEGTICPITFVKDTLFPYALDALPTVLQSKWDDRAFTPYRDAFPADKRTSPETLQAHVKDLTARDVKVAYLKDLQGYLWESGYESKAYATPLYADVVPNLKKWRAAAKRVVVYSSGSVFAQKLLFRHVRTDTAAADPKVVGETEDLSGLVGGWFDTVNAGGKTEGWSYERIARELDVGRERVLFLSDSVREVEAARGAGMHAVVVVRPGNVDLSAEERRRYDVVWSFDEL